MALLLNIDTATPYASVGVSRDGQLLGMAANPTQKAHAAFLQPAIADLTLRLRMSLGELDAIAVTIGPGSYTGLRVGLSSAKGLAYALKKPLIAVGTLEVMAQAARMAWARDPSPAAPPLLCPMIDARRDEVFTALYKLDGTVLLEPRALVLDPGVFEPYLRTNSLIFSGDGSLKWASSFPYREARFLLIQHSVADLAPLAENRYRASDFRSLAYVEPMYLKEFHKGS